MKQLGVSLKQESSVIKMKKKKKRQKERKREKKENKDNLGRCWLGPSRRVWWSSLCFFFFFLPLEGQLLIVETVGEDGVYNGAVMTGLKGSEAQS